MNQDSNNSNNNINNDNNNKNRSNKSKYAHLKHTHVPRVLQNNMPSFFDVYSMEGDAVYTIAANDIIHLPNDYQQRFSKGHNQHNNHRLIFCPHFHKCLPHNNNSNNNSNTENGDSSNDADQTQTSACPFGEECSHVHAYLGNAKINSDIHINFAYRNLHEVKYDRYDFHSTAPLRVAPPNATSPFEDLPAHLCIRTNAYIGRDRITSHCAHYYFNRICNRGSRCFFVHAVSLESCVCPTAKHANSHINSNNVTNESYGNQNNDENKPASKSDPVTAVAQDQYYVDPFYRRIYGRTEPLRHNTSNCKSSSSSAKKNQRQQRPRCQNVEESKLSHVVTDTKNSSSSSSGSSPSTPMSDDAEMTNFNNYNNNNSNNHGVDDDQYHHHHHHHHHHQYHPEESTATGAANNTTVFPQPTTTVLSSSTTNSPRTMCPGCKKFVHNPYSWTETTVCLVRTSPVSPTPSN